MNKAIYHRGPDSCGVWKSSDNSILFGHQRLSILDLSNAGAQPMLSKDEQYSIVFNGEIYNHLDIRKMLSKNFSIIWHGTSDTETLLELISCMGINKSLEIIDGMFAFALYDQKSRKLFLARDRMGEKPLYYGWSKDKFIFSSELKAFGALQTFPRRINHKIFQTFLLRSFIPAPHTIYEDCYKLMPGELIAINRESLHSNSIQKSYYWDLREVVNQTHAPVTHDFEKSKDLVKKSLESSVKQQMISDVPIGCFLSGGIDSSLITAIMQSQSSSSISTFSIGFEEQKYDESTYAKEIAKFLGTNHHEHFIDSKEALEVIPSISDIYDEPFADSSQIPTYLISKFAKNHVTVALSGDGGDELFGGYNRHIFSKKYGNLIFNTPYSLRRLAIFLMRNFKPTFLDQVENKFLQKFLNINNLTNLSNKIQIALQANNSYELYEKLIRSNAFEFDIKFDEKFSKNSIPLQLDIEEEMMFKDQIDYLPNDIFVKVDRASMAVSLETRAPFLSKDVILNSWKIDNSFKIKNGKGKYILRKILEDFIPSNLFQRPKQGFALPLDTWLRGPLNGWAKDTIYSSQNNWQEYIDFKRVNSLLDEHMSGNQNNHIEIWNILMLCSWLNKNA